jgi:pimeloyl-ACP methyl ester carboxylesterase
MINTSMIRVKGEKLTIETSDGVVITGNYFDNNSNKGVILFPGFTEHRSSLEDTAKLISTDFKTWIFDINSQGESSGNFDLNEMQRTVYEVTKFLKGKYSLSKVGAFGNSLGGMIVGMAAAQKDNLLDGICLTSAPAGLQDAVPEYAINLLSHAPQSLIRLGLIAYDKVESAKNENYRLKTHAQFKGEKGYKSYAHFGALKISDIKELAKGFATAPRLDKFVEKIKCPTLMMYGGESRLFGIKGGILPESIQNMYDRLGVLALEDIHKELIIIEGADHSLNEKTKIDDCFNQDKKYQIVKSIIHNHFSKYLL